MPDPVLDRARDALRRHQEISGALVAQQFVDGQRPGVFLITCADSRLLPEQMLGAAPGEFFIVRSVANIVPVYAAPANSFAAALEFAHFSLGVRHIVVCGHTDCGGLLALSQSEQYAHLEALSGWLDLAGTAPDVLRHPPALTAPSDPVLDRPAAHVLQQLANLRTYPYVAEAEARGALILHGWVYDLRDASLHSYDPAQALFTEMGHG